MPHEIRIKQGGSLLLQLTIEDDNDVPVDLTNMALTSQVRDAEGNLVATLPIVVTGTQGVATVTVASTALWPPGMLRADLKGVTGGLIALSETFGIRVQPAVTQ